MFPIIEVSGGAFERGRLHGQLARDLDRALDIVEACIIDAA